MQPVADIKSPYADNDTLQDLYLEGYNHGHGIACHNVPTLGEKIFSDELGRVTVDAENIREVHQSACYAAESNSRSYSPWEYTAKRINDLDYDGDDIARAESDVTAEEGWEAYEAGIHDAIQADLATYSDEDYGIDDV